MRGPNLEEALAHEKAARGNVRAWFNVLLAALRRILWNCRGDGLLVVLGLQDLATAIKAIRADMVTQVSLTSGRLNGQRWRGQKIMRTMHAALGRGFLVLLNSHDLLLIR